MKANTKSKVPPAKKSKSTGNAVSLAAKAARASAVHEYTLSTLPPTMDFKQLFEKSPDAIVVLDLKGFITSFNPATLRVSGLTEEELMGKHFSKISSVHLHDLPRLAKMFSSFLKGKTPKPFEVSFRHKDGTTRWGEVSIGLIKKKGKITGIQAVIRDITQRKKVEETLRYREKLMETASAIAAEFLNIPVEKMDNSINKALKTVGELGNADRSYIFLFSRDGLTASCTNEWCAEGVEPQIATLQNFPGKKTKTAEIMFRRKVFNITDVPGLTSEYGFEKKELQERGIQSVINVPMITRGELIGFIGLDSVKNRRTWTVDIVNFLKITGEILASALKHKETEQALKESEEKYRNVVERTSSGICIIHDKIIKYTNTRLAEMLRISVEEITDTSFTDYIHPDELATIINNYDRRMSGERLPSVYETILMCKDGSKLAVELNVDIIEYQGKPAELVLIKDLTERKQAEQKLKESESRYRVIVDNANEGIILQEASGKIVTWNRIASQVFGITVDEATQHTSTSRNWNTIREDGSEFPGAEHPSIVALSTGKPCKDVMMGVKQASGEIIWINVNTSPLFKEREAKPYAVVISFSDITERKQAEKAIRESESRYRSLFEDSKNAVYVTSREGKFLDFNQAALDLLGYSKEELIELPLKKMYANLKNRRKFQQAIEANGSVKNYEVQYRKKDGSAIDCLATVNVWLKPDGSIGGYRGIAHDITYLKKAEEERRKNTEKLLNAMKSTISAMARTVEIRNPYTAEHQRRVANLARAIAREMNMPELQVEGVYLAGIIHDIGMIYVPADILNRFVKSKTLEFSITKTHVLAGYNILKDIEFPWNISEAILNHHERLDGSGPNGLKGDKINQEARILAVADTFELMVSPPPHQLAMSIDKALEELQQNKGKLYDQDIVDACVKLINKKGLKLK